MVPWIDFEEYSPNGPRENRTWIRTFVRVLEDEIGVTPGIYTGRNIWRFEVGNSDEFSHLPLWLVHYTNRVTVPRKLDRVPDLWQWSGGRNLRHGPKVADRVVDLNRYTGPRFADLLDLRIRKPWSK